MAEETVNLPFSKPFQVRYHFNLFFYPKRWEIRICGSKENFPEGAGALHLPRSSGGRWARLAGQKARPAGQEENFFFDARGSIIPIITEQLFNKETLYAESNSDYPLQYSQQRIF